MNWSLPQQSCGAPKKAASEGFFDTPLREGDSEIGGQSPPYVDAVTGFETFG